MNNVSVSDIDMMNQNTVRLRQQLQKFEQDKIRESIHNSPKRNPGMFKTWFGSNQKSVKSRSGEKKHEEESLLLESVEGLSMADKYSYMEMDPKSKGNRSNSEHAEKPEYTRNELITLLERYQEYDKCINDLRQIIYRVEDQQVISPKKSTIKGKREILQHEIISRDKLFDFKKLRRTVIKGIPCDFI